MAKKKKKAKKAAPKRAKKAKKAVRKPSKKSAKKIVKKVKKVAKKKVVKKAKKVVKKAKKKAKKAAVKKVPTGGKIKIIAGKSIDLAKEKPVGEVVHYYGKIRVGVIEVHAGQEIHVGETLYYSGHTTDFHDQLNSMQEYGKQIDIAKGKKQVGVKVSKKVRQGDRVFKITKI